jgi:hypothetical protein
MNRVQSFKLYMYWDMPVNLHLKGILKLSKLGEKLSDGTIFHTILQYQITRKFVHLLSSCY